MIQQMKFSGYFLIVWDFIRFAKSRSIPVGPGRGSAAGSLVSYALRITDVDPLQYDLLFERFLNPQRVSLQPSDQDPLSAPYRRWQTEEGRACCLHAKTPHRRQCHGSNQHQMAARPTQLLSMSKDELD